MSLFFIYLRNKNLHIMKKYFLILIVLLTAKLGFAQTPEITFHSCTPETITTNEETEIVITLMNNGDAATENNTFVTLSSDDQYVTVVGNHAIYGPMAAGATQDKSFTIFVNSMIPDDHSISLNIKAVLEGSSVISSVSFDFETGIQGWTTIDADGDGFDWIESGASPHRYEDRYKRASL